MECIQGALKSSSAEMVLKSTVQQTTAFDDLWSVNSNGQTADDFFVDNLLDFSEAPVLDEEQVCDLHTQQDTTLVLQNELQEDEEIKDSSLSAVTGSDLYVPADDAADLEWLSHFVDDSSAGYSLTVPAGIVSVKPKEKCTNRKITALGEAVWTGPPVQTKARSKRSRTGVRVWSLGSNSLTDSSTSSSSSSQTTAFFYNDLTQSAESLFGKRPLKKRAAADSSGQPRRCSHCLVQKTPQWRTGPLGAKTLCNACGVRFKSGRLLPEYRPACSPTFSSEIHSNNHRKVMEMRRKKDGEDGVIVEV